MAQIGRFVAVGGSLNDASSIGFSSNGGENWTVSTETNGLFNNSNYGRSVAYGYTPDGSGVFVAGGYNDVDGSGGIIGYSLDGGVSWFLAANPDEACGDSFEGIATDGSGVFVAVGNSEDDLSNIGFSLDGGLNWQVAANTDGLFQGDQGYGIAYGYTLDGSGVFVAVGHSQDDLSNIGFSTDGGLNWQVATNTNGLFQGGRGNGIAYGLNQDGSGIFVAVGDSLDDLSNIGFSLDGGENWQVAANTNGLFSGGEGRGIVSATINGIGGFMAVGSSLDDLNNIGISDGSNVNLWNPSSFLLENGLFQGGGGYGVAYDGNGTFVAVGKSTDDLSNIGYLTIAPGASWTIATATDGLFRGANSSGRAIAFGYAAPPTPPNPIYNICFPAGTPIKTDQGIFPIEKLHRNKHTINQYNIQHITKTVTQDTHLICFEKNALGPNMPSALTRMTKEHKILFEGRYVAAEKFLSLSKKVTKVKYNGELLYNVLLETYGTLQVNNLVCETLHPDNLIAKLYNNYKEAERPDLVCQLNASLLERNVKKYKAVERKILHK